MFPEIEAAYDNIWTSGSKKDLAESDTIETDIKSLYGTRAELSDETASELARLYEAGYSNAIIADTKDSLEYDGEDYELSAAQQQRYEQTIKANMDMLCSEKRRDIFPADRPVRTRNHEEVSTYYGENACSKNSLVADNCIIEGHIENCIVFSGAFIAKGASLKNCIVMQHCVVESGCELNYVIADKSVTFSEGTKLLGCENLPVVVQKNRKV